MSFERAAELTAVPDDRILEATTPFVRIVQRRELLAIADDLGYQARFAQLSFVKRRELYVGSKLKRRRLRFRMRYTLALTLGSFHRLIAAATLNEGTAR